MILTLKPDRNIRYTTDEIARYYGTHRTTWDDFYPSERWIFERIGQQDASLGDVLDVGCAAGGLGAALGERFLLDYYVGIDVNCQAIEVARRETSRCLKNDHRFICGDILEAGRLPRKSFDMVVSLSCADWNVQTDAIIAACWKYVKRGGHLVLTLRLSPRPSIRDFEKSYQYIYFLDRRPKSPGDAQKAPYVVFNVKDAFSLLNVLEPRPERIVAYGYWGNPSETARTPYDRLCFTALAVKKARTGRKGGVTTGELHVPIDLFTG